jgi:hypothetical protein
MGADLETGRFFPVRDRRFASARAVGRKLEMHHSVTAITAQRRAPSYLFLMMRERIAPASKREASRHDNRAHVMTSTIITAIAASFLIVSAWVADLACYHSQADGFDLLAPINTTTAWK